MAGSFDGMNRDWLSEGHLCKCNVMSDGIVGVCGYKYIMKFIIIIIIIIMSSLVTGLLSPVPLLSICDPHSTAFRFQSAALSVLCVMVRVQLSVVVYLLSVVSVWHSNFSSKLLLLFRASNYCLTIIHFLFHIGCIYVHITLNSQCFF